MKTSRRLIVVAAASMGVLVALVGVAHMRFAHPLLAMLTPGSAMAASGQPGRCPFGFDRKVTAADRERSIQQFAATHAGTRPAQSRPADGFLLETSTRAQVIDWAHRNKVDCHPRKVGDDLECLAVPLRLLPDADATQSGTVETAWLSFDGANRLSKVITVQHLAGAEATWAAFTQGNAALTRETGVAPELSGETSAQGLGAGLLRQASAETRARNYYALVRVTNLGARMLLTREYRALPMVAMR